MRHTTLVPVLVSIVVAISAATAAFAVSVPFRSTFNLDTVGMPPTLGGPYQPTLMVSPEGSVITVVADSLGLSDQPAELHTPDGWPPPYLRWNLVPAVTELGVDISFRVSLGQLYSGHFFQASVQDGSIPVRLHATASGLLQLNDGCGAIDVGAYSPGVPINVIVRWAPPDAVWLIVDGENDGFENNTPFATTSCNPGNLAHLWVFAGGGTDPVTVALDDLVVGWLPLFVDGFELGDTSLWSAEVP